LYRKSQINDIFYCLFRIIHDTFENLRKNLEFCACSNKDNPLDDVRISK